MLVGVRDGNSVRVNVIVGIGVVCTVRMNDGVAVTLGATVGGIAVGVARASLVAVAVPVKLVGVTDGTAVDDFVVEGVTVQVWIATGLVPVIAVAASDEFGLTVTVDV